MPILKINACLNCPCNKQFSALVIPQAGQSKFSKFLWIQKDVGLWNKNSVGKKKIINNPAVNKTVGRSLAESLFSIISVLKWCITFGVWFRKGLRVSNLSVYHPKLMWVIMLENLGNPYELYTLLYSVIFLFLYSISSWPIQSILQNI